LVLWFSEISFLRENPTHEMQFAYKRNSGCDIALSVLTNKIEKSFSEDKMVVIVFLTN
jgi:hypothetical protein